MESLDSLAKRELAEIFKRALSIKISATKPKLLREVVPASQWVNDEYYLGAEESYIYPYWKREIVDIFEINRGRFNEIVVTGGLGCRPEGTLYDTTAGRLSLLELRVLFYNHNRRDIAVLDGAGKRKLIVGVHSVGMQPTVAVTFSDGFVMEATRDHRIKVLGELGGIEWRRFDELRVTDRVIRFHDVRGIGRAYATRVFPYVQPVSFTERVSFCGDIEVEDHEYLNDGIINHNTGKSTFANLCMIRKLYELSCYENVNGLFELMPSSLVGIMYFNVSRAQAELTGYGQFKSMVDSIPYFRDNFPRNEKISSILEYPENILFTCGSAASHAIGMNLIGTILDEANFFQKDAQATDKTQADYQKVSRMYSSIVNRSASRFMTRGVDHSLSILVSSNTTSSSFTETRIRKSLVSGTESRTKVINARVWEVKPPGTYSDKTFWVFKGSNLLDPFLVESLADINHYMDTVHEPHVLANSVEEAMRVIGYPHIDKFVAIPIDFKKSFVLNISMALQDIAGISTSPLGRLFSSRQTYLEACDTDLVHPFYRDDIIVSTKDALVMREYLRRDYVPKDKGSKRYIHIDQSVSTDSTGYASAYVSGWVLSPEGVNLPVVTVDLKIRVVPPKPPRKISIQKIVDFTFYLRDHFGLEIAMVSQDTYASQMAMQIYEEAGIPSVHYSVDRTDEAYLLYTTMLHEGRIRTYQYKEEEEELFDLLHFREKRKVDHPVGSCLVGSTKVVVGTGYEYIKNMVGTQPKILGLTREKIFVQTPACKVWLADRVTETLEIHLSNGESFECTGNHPIMRVTFDYCRADQLIEGDRLLSRDDSIWVEGITKHFYEKGVDVYDIEVPETSNFMLECGIMVHNSKDVTDAIVGCVYHAVQGSKDMSPGGSTSRIDAMNQAMLMERDEELFSMAELLGIDSNIRKEGDDSGVYW